MTKALKRYAESEREFVVRRRLLHKTEGLGYWSAMDYRNKKKSK